jgi:hypothetical protein
MGMMTPSQPLSGLGPLGLTSRRPNSNKNQRKADGKKCSRVEPSIISGKGNLCPTGNLYPKGGTVALALAGMTQLDFASPEA